MKASEYIVELQKLVDEYGDQELVYSCDSEGNRFSKVGFMPGAGCFNKQEWIGENQFEEYDDEMEVNSFCIN